MSTKTKPQDDDTANWAWLRSWTKSVDLKLALILTGKVPISEDLEREVNKTTVLTKVIDRSVPDNKKG